jgi:hypothetical protein
MHVRKKFFKTPNRPSSSLFERFFIQQDIQGIWEEYLQSKLATSEIADAEVIFACGAILGEKLDGEWINKFPSPLSLSQFENKLQEQFVLETDNSKNGILTQPKYLEKILLASAIGLSSKKDVFIELGTYLGHSVRKISNLFNVVLTVEASPILHKASRKLFEATQCNINCSLDNSVDFLKKLDSSLGNSSVIFIDSHYSTGITSKEFGICPVLEEIEIILERFPNAICVVDDIRCMNGENGYPKLAEILDLFSSSQVVLIAFDQLIFSANKTAKLNVIDEIFQLRRGI